MYRDATQTELLTWLRVECCSVPGVGTVVAGTLKHGIIVPGATLMLGPDIGDGTFKLTAIKSIHYKRLPVAQVIVVLATLWMTPAAWDFATPGLLAHLLRTACKH